MKVQTKSILLALLAVLFWSTAGTAMKLSLQHISFELLLFYSVLTANIILFTTQLSRKKIRAIFHVPIKDMLLSALLGFLNPFMYYLILLKAYDILPAQIAVALNYTWPIILVLLSIPLLKQRISWKSIMALLISFIGIAIISTKGELFYMKVEHPFGVGLAFFSAFVWATYWLLNMKDKRPPIPKLTLNFLFGLCYISAYLLIQNKITLPTIPGIIGSVYIGIFELAITYILWLKALSLSKNIAKVSHLIYLSPFISLLLIQLLVKEPILKPTIFGLSLIILGILMQQYFETRKS